MTIPTSPAEPGTLAEAKTRQLDPFPMIRGVVGAIVGGALGSVLFYLALRQRLYAIVLPGALAGIFCGGFLGRRSMPMGIVCGLIGAAFTLWIEWRFFPFIADNSFVFFLTHLHRLKPASLLLIALGIGMAGWFGMGRDGVAWLETNRRRKGNLRNEG